MLKSLLQWWAEMCCPDHKYDFVRNVYGDEINALNARSIWICRYCRKVRFDKELHSLSEPPR